MVRGNLKEKEHNRKAQNISAYSAYMVFAVIAVVLAKAFGFVREILITNKFGYGVVTDAYYLGFAVPDLVYNILVGGAISAAIVPILSGAIERDQEHKVWPSISSFFTFIMIAFAGFMLVGEVFSKDIISFLNPDQSPEVVNIATSVSRVVYLQTFFFILIAIVNSALSANKVYGLPALGDSVYNIFYLLSVLILASPSKKGAIAVAWGVVIAAVMYFLYMFYFARPYLRQYKPRLNLADKQFWYIVWLAIPALLSGTVAQLNTIVQQKFAGSFDGAVTSLRNAQTLFNLPFQVIVTSIGAFVLSNVSGFLAKDDHKSASEFFGRAIKLVLVIMIPVALFFGVFSEETVQAVYQWNRQTYTDENVIATAKILRIFSIQFVSGPILYFLNQALFAFRKNYVTLITTVIDLLTNYLFCYLLIDVWHLGIESLAWSSTLSGIFVTLISYVVVSFVGRGIRVPGAWSYLFKSLVSGFFAFSVIFFLHTILPDFASKIVQLLVYVVSGIISVGAYFVAGYLLQIFEVTWVFKMIEALFKKVTQTFKGIFAHDS